MLQSFKKYFLPYVPIFKIITTAIIAFTIYRICFIFFNSESIPADAPDKLYLYSRALLFGLNFDLVIICYIIPPFFIFIAVTQFSGKSFSTVYSIFKWYFIILFTVCMLICAADIPYYKQFGGHLNKEFFVWTDSPGFVFKLIFSNIAYWGYLILFFLLSMYIYKSISKIVESIQIQKATTNKLSSVGIFLLLGLLIFVGIRGRTAAKSPIRVGTAFFSEYAFFNQLGLNPCFVFAKSIAEQGKKWKFLSSEFTDTELTETIKNISPENKHAIQNSIERTYAFDSTSRKYNVVIVLMESMAISKMGYYNCAHLTSRFDTLVSKGVFFNKFYSAGIHTFNGLFSTETGFPAIMDIHPLNTYDQKAFKGIAYWLKQNGYSNYFFTCHDPQFDNMEGFMKFNYFDRIYSQTDYPKEKALSALGVPDHYLFEYALQKMDEHHKEKNTPFFSYILTSSDHGPWEIPADIPFKPSAENIQDRATQYTDWSLGHLIDEAKKYDWFKNTLFVFVADHGLNWGHTYSMPLSYNHIPCLFYMPSQLKPDTISSLGGQIDVFPTIMSFLKTPFKNTSMGIDLMHETRPYMYFTADSKIGCIDNEYYYIHLLDEKKELLYKYKNLDTHSYLDENKSKADSMKNYSEKMIRTANHIIQNKLY